MICIASACISKPSSLCGAHRRWRWLRWCIRVTSSCPRICRCSGQTEDYDINETHAHIILVKDPETGELERSPAIMDFASSKLRVSKAWNSQIGMKGGDRFAGLKSSWRTYREQDGQSIHELRSLVCRLGSGRRLQGRRRSLRAVLQVRSPTDRRAPLHSVTLTAWPTVGHNGPLNINERAQFC